MVKKDITINDLAVMVQKGFSGVDKRFDAMHNEMDKRFDLVDKRFDKVENLILENHRKRIEKMEAEIKDLKELFAM